MPIFVLKFAKKPKSTNLKARKQTTPYFCHYWAMLFFGFPLSSLYLYNIYSYFINALLDYDSYLYFTSGSKMGLHFRSMH